MIHEPLIFELSEKGKRAFSLPELDVPSKKDILKGHTPESSFQG
jgi:hypothetical protein